tara:strand:+ start:1076 stop:1285 length:210 start_codon:yes stop_codon:yes gene_type:complete
MRFTKTIGDDHIATRADGVIITISHCDDYIAVWWSNDDDECNCYDTVKQAKLAENGIEKRMIKNGWGDV